MSNEAPTDALRLVPVSLISDTMNAMARAYERIHSMPRVSDTELAKKVDEAKERLRPYLAAPASPLPEGGGPTCQVCGSKIEAWTCQGCGAQFHENDAGSLVLGVPAAPTGDRL